MRVATVQKPLAQPQVRTHCDFAYVVQFENTDALVKVGRSANPSTRIAGLRSSSPFGLRSIAILSDGAKREREMKDLLSFCRVRGEWFKPVKELNDYLAKAFSSGAVLEKHIVDADFVDTHIKAAVVNYLEGKQRLHVNELGNFVYRFLREGFDVFKVNPTLLVKGCPQYVSPELVHGYLPAMIGGIPPQIAVPDSQSIADVAPVQREAAQ